MKPLNCSAFTSRAVIAIIILIAGALSACESMGHHDATIGEPEFGINASSTEIMQGETVTLTTRSKNVEGRQTEIQWRADGADLTVENNGRVARVRFDQPGTYIVTSTMNIDNQMAQSSSVTVKVKPLVRK